MKWNPTRCPSLLLACMLLGATPAFAQQGYLVTMGGNGTVARTGDGGQALAASLTPTAITFDANGNIFFVDGASVRKVRPDGVIATVATLPAAGAGLAVAKDGSLFVSLASELRRIAPNGAVTSYAETVTALAMGPDGSLYMVDPTHHRVRRMASGVISNFAGNGTAGDCLSTDAGIVAVSPCLQTPADVVAGADGTVFVTDTGNDRTYIISNGQMKLLSISTSVSFFPDRIALGPDGRIYGLLRGGNLVVSAQARQVWENYSAFVVGDGTDGFNGDQLAANTELNAASDFDIDAQGNLVIADTLNHRLRRMRIASPAARSADYDHDGLGDVVWRNRKTGANVEWWGYQLAGSTPLATVTNADWDIVASGDFDGDQFSDLVWRNRRTGADALWRSANAGTQAPIPAVTDVNWKVVGTGDFNGDGRRDLLWRNGTTGKNVIWLGAQSTTQQAVADATPEWQVAGIGDFWADGKSDILWRNTVTGANMIWRSGNAATPQSIGSVGLGWHVAGIGDFDGEGRSDILWRNDAGSNVVWLSANAQTTRAMSAVAGSGWTVASVGDYDIDWASDILWRNGATGANVIWSAADAHRAHALPVVSPDWVMSTNPGP